MVGANSFSGNATPVEPAETETVRGYLAKRSRAVHRCSWTMVVGLLVIIGILGLLGDSLGRWGSIVASLLCLTGFAVYAVAITRALRQLKCPYCGTRLDRFDLLWPSHSLARDGKRFGRNSAKIRYLPCCRGLIDAELPVCETNDDRA